MREIKFRAWDKVDYMSNPFTLQDIQDKKIQFTSDCPVMQFTGLKDKNGLEIYEGDILMADPVLEVIFNDGGFCFKNTLTTGSDRLSQDRVGRLVIIGNIYEHKHMVK